MRCGYPVRDHARERVARGSPRPELGRRDVDGLDLEQLDALGPRQRSEHIVEPLLGNARPGADAQAGELEHALRLLPGEEMRELVGADHEHRIGQVERFQRVDRSRVPVELDLDT